MKLILNPELGDVYELVPQTCKSSREKDLASKHAALAEEVEAMLAFQKALEEENARLQEAIGDKEALIDQNESLQVQLKAMTAEVGAMRSRLAEIQSLAGVEAGVADENQAGEAAVEPGQ
jgi:hypothetical protein